MSIRLYDKNTLALAFAWRQLNSCRPSTPSPYGRHIAIAITKLEEAMAYYEMWCANDFDPKEFLAAYEAEVD